MRRVRRTRTPPVREPSRGPRPRRSAAGPAGRGPGAGRGRGGGAGCRGGAAGGEQAGRGEAGGHGDVGTAPGGQFPDGFGHGRCGGGGVRGEDRHAVEADAQLRGEAAGDGRGIRVPGPGGGEHDTRAGRGPPARLGEAVPQRVDEERVGAERGGDAGADPRRRRGGGLRQVLGDVVAGCEEQRDEHRVGALGQGGQGVAQQGFVQLDVAEPYGQPGPQGADHVEERGHGGHGTRVAAAVGDGDQGGRAGRPVQWAHGGLRLRPGVGSGGRGSCVDPDAATLPGCCAGVTAPLDPAHVARRAAARSGAAVRDLTGGSHRSAAADTRVGVRPAAGAGPAGRSGRRRGRCTAAAG